MIVIGLTGGIGAGKSTLSEYLREKNYKIIDADKMARRMTEKGSRTLDEIAEAFGQDMILPDGNLDRKKLAGVVFGDEEKKKKLEELTTHKVVAQIAADVDWMRCQGKMGIAFVDAPLLFECGLEDITDYVWLVTAEPEVRIERVMARDNASREEVKARIAKQMSDEEKKKKSDFILDNSKGKEELYRQADVLLKDYEKEI